MTFLKCLTGFFFLSIIFPVFSLPQQIILIRHADKNFQGSGYFLNQKGRQRAESFAQYYLKTFSPPDFVIATNPFKKNKIKHAFREIQTVAPLINVLNERHIPVTFLTPYSPGRFAKLVQYLKKPQFNHKIILICWNHSNIPHLATLLVPHVHLSKWNNNDFSSVYVIDFKNANAKLFIRKQQY